MELNWMTAAIGGVVVVAAGIFTRALWRGSRVLGSLLDQRSPRKRQR